MWFNQFWSSVEKNVFYERNWIEQNIDLIPPKDSKVFISAITWNTEWLNAEERREAENIRRRRLDRQNSKSYGVKDTKDEERLYQKNSIKEVKKAQEKQKAQNALNELIETAFADLLELLLKDKWIKVRITSDHDDIIAWIDYILEATTSEWPLYIWIDLTLSWSSHIQENKSIRKDCTPEEFKLIKIENWEIWADQKILKMERQVFAIEPNFAQLFLSEYLDIVRVKTDTKEITKDTAATAWQFTLERYQTEEFELTGEYRQMTQGEVIRSTKNQLQKTLNG